ncbi:MAG: hypothetical protein WBS54_00345 [Acidobacteriota bacterium]
MGFWAALAACAVLVASVPAAAQTADEVYLYEALNYGGSVLRLDHNVEIADLSTYHVGGTDGPSWRERISSLKVGANKKLLLFAKPDFQGGVLVVGGDSCKQDSGNWAFLPGGWNKRACSLKVVNADRPAPHAPSLAATEVYLYELKDYGGNYLHFDHEAEVADLRSYNTGGQGSPGWNHRISSIEIGSGMKITLWAKANFKGSSFIVTGPATIPCLRGAKMNDKISSFKISSN